MLEIPFGIVAHFGKAKRLDITKTDIFLLGF